MKKKCLPRVKVSCSECDSYHKIEDLIIHYSTLPNVLYVTRISFKFQLRHREQLFGYSEIHWYMQAWVHEVKELTV